MKEFLSTSVEWLGHASVKLENDLTVYIDPWSEVMNGSYRDADIIVSTHDHFDHFDPEMIDELSNDDTVVIVTEESREEVPDDLETEVIAPGETVEAKGVTFEGVHAYNVDKFREEGEPFHPKGFSTGVVFEFDGARFYHASDTDPIDEMNELEGIDVAFLPVGGHYTMNQDEAVEAVKKFSPDNVVPIHFGTVENTSADTDRFKEDVERETDSKVVVLESEN